MELGGLSSNMVFKDEENKINFVVDTLCSIGFEHKGGSIAVHKIANEIANSGHNVYVFNEPFYPHPNINVIPTTQEKVDGGWRSNFTWENFSYPLHKTVTLYTQNTWGNPFGTMYNCRWILHDYEESQWETYGSEDVIYNYGSFKVPENTNQKLLTVIDYGLDLYINKNLGRKGFCYIIHKFTPEWGYDFLKNFGAKNLTDLMFDGKFKELSEEFNRFEYLITFDSKSAITTAAVLCGCKVVILNPNKNITPTEFRRENPIQMCGVAYGWDDLEWANNTISLAKTYIENLQKMDKQTVTNFVQFWENKIYDKK